jgi:hypothetical protein
MQQRHWPRRGSAVLLAAGIFTFAAAPANAGAASTTASASRAVSPSSPVPSRVLATTTNWGHASSPAAAAQAKASRSIARRSPGNASAANHAAAAALPNASSSALAAEGTLAANFDGLSDAQNKLVAGFHDTPPDQGLCSGTLDGFGGQVVIEAVNSIFGIYTPSGTLLTSFPVTAGFFDPNAFSDPRCFWDTSTQSFYMTVISCSTCGPPGTADSVDDVLVVSSAGFATTYQYSTNQGGTCFGDQPHTGYDSNALWIATDEFCGPSGNNYTGAQLIGISKSQLVAQGPPPNAVSFTGLTLGGIPVLTLQPAFGNDSGNEYLLNSFPFDQFGNNNSIAKTLGFWVVTGGQNITTGTGTVVLSGQVIGSETYAFPGPAASTGTGVSTGSGCATHTSPCETSEAFLNPDDSRMQQVQLVNDEKRGPQLYASLSTALTIGKDPSARDGAAWFVLNPAKAKITNQGYVGVAGAYLLYPAILHTSEGTTAMGFTLTSPTINPSAAFVVWKSTSSHFGSVQTVALGTAPHVSFSDVPFGRARWGDYSALELDPNGTNIWSGTEYIGGNGAADTVDNWGTRIWDVTGDQ